MTAQLLAERENTAQAPAPPSESPRIAYVAGGLYTESSGVVRIVCGLANAVARQSRPVSVYTAACEQGEPVGHLLDPANPLIAPPGRWMGRLAWSPALRRRLRADAQSLDVLHNHSVWMLPNHYACEAARRARRPYMFSGHGALEPWALARSRWKKRLVNACFQRRDLRGAACIHVNTHAEAQGLRRLGLNHPIPVIPNGVDLSPYDAVPPKDRLVAEFPELADRRIVLFLSRLHSKKGLAHLLPAWRRVAPDHPDWHLLIVGPDDGFEAEVRRLMDVPELKHRVTLAGPRRGEEKSAALGAAEGFVLPSFSEGFSMAVLEAMAARLPVILTPGCNFPEVERAGAGWLVRPDEQDTERGIRELLELPDADRERMGLNGRQLVESHYTFGHVAHQMLEVYRWLAGGGDRPNSVNWH